MKKYTLQSDNELRGFKIRLYPDEETIKKLHILESDCRVAWNWLVKQAEDVLYARQAYAVREKLVVPKPQVPIYDGLESQVAKETKINYINLCQKWHNDVYRATNKLPGCEFRKLKDLICHFGFKQDYQLMSQVIKWHYDESKQREIVPNAHILQSLVKNYFTKGKNQRRKKFRKQQDSMPLQVRSGDCFKLGEFGNRRGNPFYNCQISFNGLKIKGRLPGKLPEGRILEGVSIIKEADGWWASIKQEVPKRNLAPVIPNTTIGIDVGLDYIVAMSDGTQIKNPRDKFFAEKIAELQKQKKETGRLHLQAKRNLKHILYNEVIKPLENTEIIKIEKLPSGIGQNGSSKISVMRTIAFLLKERYGERVREVECAYTSQMCSQCGFLSKESWSYEHGRKGKCPACGYEEDRDVNAARNIAAK